MPILLYMEFIVLANTPLIENVVIAEWFIIIIVIYKTEDKTFFFRLHWLDSNSRTHPCPTPAELAAMDQFDHIILLHVGCTAVAVECLIS